MNADILTPFITGDNKPEPEQNIHNEEIREELTLKVIDEVFSKKDIEVKTDLTDNQVIQFTRGRMFHAIFGSPRMLLLVDTLSIYSVSKARKGRKEFTDIAKAINSYDAGGIEPLGVRDRLFGKGY